MTFFFVFYCEKSYSQNRKATLSQEGCRPECAKLIKCDKTHVSQPSCKNLFGTTPTCFEMLYAGKMYGTLKFVTLSCDRNRFITCMHACILTKMHSGIISFCYKSITCNNH